MIFKGSVQAEIDSALARQSSGDAGGVLVGTADPGLGLVVVLGVEALPRPSPASGVVEFTPAIWARMIDVVLERHPGQRIVGWYHGHAGSGAFLSGHDLLIHTTYFGQPWQVAYVVDPTSGERGLFGWRDHAVTRLERWDVTSSAGANARSSPDTDSADRAPVLRHLADTVHPRTRTRTQPVPVARETPAAPPTVPIPPSAPISLDSDAASDPVWPSPWGYPVGTSRVDAPIVSSTDHASVVDDGDLDAWIASLPSGDTAPPAGVEAEAAPPVPTIATSVEEESLAHVAIGPRGPSRQALLIGLVAVIVVVIVLVVVFASGSDDKESASTSAVPTTATTATTSGAIATTPRVTTPSAPTTVETELTVATSPPTSSTIAPTTSPPPSASPSPPPTTLATLPPTPTGVTAPADRVGIGSTLCPLDPDGQFEPVANCFVPLSNGNIVASFNGSLMCVDPPETNLGEAAPFRVGFGDDPLVVIAGGVALPFCDDLSYAKNVMAAGAPTLDGLCGNNNTSISPKSTRCFAQNPTTGAIVALVTAPGTDEGLAGLCFNGAGQPSSVTLTWTTRGVDATWRIVSVAFEPGAQQFVATVNRSGELATALLACT